MAVKSFSFEKVPLDFSTNSFENNKLWNYANNKKRENIICFFFVILIGICFATWILRILLCNFFLISYVNTQNLSLTENFWIRPKFCIPKEIFIFFKKSANLKKYVWFNYCIFKRYVITKINANNIKFSEAIALQLKLWRQIT